MAGPSRSSEELRSRSQEHRPPDLAGRLAPAYIHRARSRHATNDYAGAFDDYERAIGVIEDLRGETPDEWSEYLDRGLATAVTGRGVARAAGGDLVASIDDFGRAIEVTEDLRKQLGDRWLDEMAAERATAYLYRGTARQASGHSGALNDFIAAVVYFDHLQDQMGEGWLPEYDESMRVANNGAIELLEAMHVEHGEKMRPILVAELAKAHTRRAIERSNTGDLPGRLDATTRALDLVVGLSERRDAHELPDLPMMVAIAYANRGEALGDRGDVSAALADFGHSIDRHQQIQDEAADTWSPSAAFRSAKARIMRSDLSVRAGDPAGAQRDLDRARAILERLKEQMGEGWPAEYDERLDVAREASATVTSSTT